MNTTHTVLSNPDSAFDSGFPLYRYYCINSPLPQINNPFSFNHPYYNHCLPSIHSTFTSYSKESEDLMNLNKPNSSLNYSSPQNDLFFNLPEYSWSCLENSSYSKETDDLMKLNKQDTCSFNYSSFENDLFSSLPEYSWNWSENGTYSKEPGIIQNDNPFFSIHSWNWLENTQNADADTLCSDLEPSFNEFFGLANLELLELNLCDSASSFHLSNTSDSSGNYGRFEETQSSINCFTTPENELAFIEYASCNSTTYSKDVSALLNNTKPPCNQDLTTDNSNSKELHQSSPKPILTTIKQAKTRKKISVTELNLSDTTLMLNHEDVPQYRKANIKMIQNKIIHQALKYDHRDYLKNATLLIMSESPVSHKLSFCGVPTSKSKGMCKLHQHCPRCCYSDMLQHASRITPYYNSIQPSYVTISFHGTLAYSEDNLHKCIEYWDACKKAIRAMYKEGLLSGAYWTEELSVVSLNPATLLPHVHAIFDKLHENDIEDRMRSFLEDSDGPLQPDVQIVPVNSLGSLASRLKYLHKTFSLARQYDTAWSQIRGRKAKLRLNNTVIDLIQGYSLINSGRKKRLSVGTLDTRCSKYIGDKNIKKRIRVNKYSEMLKQLDSAQDCSCTTPDIMLN